GGAAGVVGVGAGFGDEPDLAAAGATVLGHVIPGQHLHFLNRVHVLDADDRARRARPNRRRPVDGDVVLVGAAAVDVEAAVAEIGEAARIEIAAHHTHLQPDHADGVAPGERQL